ncbi:MAG: FRG domain-containing protein [Gammaproteobacteria bacterium]|nr:FRG domain-containing protein [Gammaproteobacteria bacterium]
MVKSYTSPRAIHSVIEFVEWSLDLAMSKDRKIIFRGHSNSTYKNSPSVLRDANLKENENIMLSELVSLHPEDFGKDTTALEQLVRAQHYGLPTRLLDVSFNPLAALYFACREKEEYDGEVIVFFVDDARIKQYYSDTVSCLTNLAFLSKSQKDEISTNINRMLRARKFSDRDEIKKLRNSKPMKKLLHFIRQEKPQFRSEIQPGSLRQFVVVKPKRSNRRIIAQSGAFIVFGVVPELGDSGTPNESKKFEIMKVLVPKESKNSILDQLDRLSINASTMFPDIDQTAIFLKNQYKN